ncbi:MAG: glucose-6-phosphate isomerase family protein [Nitrososphaerota archaeon]
MTFATKIDMVKLLMENYTNHKVVKLSSLREYFSEPEKVDETLREKGDVVVYEYFEKIFENGGGHLNFGLTILYPGKVGREYFMTRGHFHEKQAAEIYVGLEGEGLILMQSEDGRVEWQPLELNRVVYVPPGWGHRTINIGQGKLVLFFAYPSDAGHDYEIVRVKGFAKLVLEEEGRFVLKDNPRYVAARGF